MDPYLIGTLNNISPVGLGKLTDGFKLTVDVAQANGIIVRSFKMHDMDFSDNLLAIGRAGAGVNNIPLERCADQGIVVFNAPGANSNAVKELAIAGMIMGARNMYEGISWGQTLTGDVATEVEKGKKQFAGTEISGKTLGVIGLGAIGAKIANAAEALGMKVVGYEAFKPHPCLTADVKLYDSAEEMVPECDFVTIHVPSLPTTKGMVNKDLIARMKDGVIFMNYARPDLIVVDDVVEALESGKMRKYMTDLLEPEYIGKKGIVATPHLGASTEEAEDNCAVMAVEEVMDYLQYGNVRCCVNLPNLTVAPVAGTKRVCVITKGLKFSVDNLIAEAVGADNIVALQSNNRVGFAESPYEYTIALVKDSADLSAAAAIAGDGVLRVRVL
ncbi:MAG: 3-phosphoglycerate dehydrogenase [Mogibacterium sp.]|nr:3-phosphoglycerate dehydrogenase [Mogibacterium sp.]